MAHTVRVVVIVFLNRRQQQVGGYEVRRHIFRSAAKRQDKQPDAAAATEHSHTTGRFLNFHSNSIRNMYEATYS